MDNNKRLGELVKAKRMRLYRTVDAARAEVKISRGAWDNVEHGRPVKELTYFAVETALGWEPGSCQRVLAGGEPVNTSNAQYAREVLNSGLSEATKAYILQVLRDDDPTPEPPAEHSDTTETG